MRNVYLAALRRLPITSPTLSDVRAVMPHISLDRAQEIMQTTSYAFVAVPPTRVKSVYHVICFRTVGGTSELQYAYTDLRAWAGNEANGAMTYAANMWPESLVDDDWTDFVKIMLVDRAIPTRTGTLYITLRCSLFAILNENGNSLEDHIGEYTPCWLVAEEIKGNRGAYCAVNCARCGGRMRRDVCGGCGAKVEGCFCDGFDALPPSLVQVAADAGFMRRKS